MNNERDDHMLADHLRKVQLLNPRQTGRLLPVDPLALQAGLLGSNPDGLFKL